MKHFEVKALGLEEMKSKDVISTDGGSLTAVAIFILGACAGGLIWDIVGNPKATKKAWNEGKEEVFSK